jgi:hypothetical protein
MVTDHGKLVTYCYYLLIDEGTAQCERIAADDGNALCGGWQLMILLLLMRKLLTLLSVKEWYS